MLPKQGKFQTMIGQKAILSDGRETTIVGFIEWGSENNHSSPRIRRIITTQGVRDDNDKRMDRIRIPKNVTICN